MWTTTASTLVSVAIGAGVGLVATLTADMLRGRRAARERIESQKREDRLDRRDRALAAYVGLLVEANTLYARCREFLEGGTQEESPAAVRRARESLTAAMSPAFLLTAEEDLRLAIGRLIREARDLGDACLSESPDRAHLEALLAAHRQAVIDVETLIRELVL